MLLRSIKSKNEFVKKMMRVSKQISFGKQNKEYFRTTYNCKEDDVWVVVEIPKDIFKKTS